MRYGRKGGDGPTRGKTARTFEATLPDGSVVRKRIFHDLVGLPWAYCYQHQGTWYIAGIREQGCARLRHYTAVPARELGRQLQAQDTPGFVEAFRVHMGNRRAK